MKSGAMLFCPRARSARCEGLPGASDAVRQVLSARAHQRGRHGRGVQGQDRRRRGLREARRDQAHPALCRRGRRVHQDVRRRGEDHLAAHPREPRPDLRPRQDQRHLLHRDGVRAGQGSARGLRAAQAPRGLHAAPARRLRDGARLRGAGLRAPKARSAGQPAAHRPPRRLAPERDRLVRGRGEAHRLWHRQGGQQDHQDAGGNPQGKVRLHEPGAGARVAARPAQRHLRGRRGALRNVHQRAALHRQLGLQRAGESAGGEDHPALGSAAAHPAQARARDPESAGPRARRSLPARGRSRGRPDALPPRDPGKERLARRCGRVHEVDLSRRQRARARRARCNPDADAAQAAAGAGERSQAARAAAVAPAAAAAAFADRRSGRTLVHPARHAEPCAADSPAPDQSTFAADDQRPSPDRLALASAALAAAASAGGPAADAAGRVVCCRADRGRAARPLVRRLANHRGRRRRGGGGGHRAAAGQRAVAARSHRSERAGAGAPRRLCRGAVR